MFYYTLFFFKILITIPFQITDCPLCDQPLGWYLAPQTSFFSLSLSIPNMMESSSPSVTPIKLLVQYSGKKLDKLKSNYKEWCEEITIALSLNGLYKYVAGTITKPTTSETHALINWKANSHLTYVFLASSIIPSECPFIDMEKDMTVNWEALCKQHQNEGPVCQVQSLQQVLTIQCTTKTPLLKMAKKICAFIDHVFILNLTSFVALLF